MLGANPFSSEVWIALAAGALGSFTAVLIGYFLFVRQGEGTQARAKKTRPFRTLKKKTKALRDPFLHGSGSERRTGLRRKGNEIEVTLRDADVKVNLGIGWVLDRSVGGLCLKVQKKFDVGEILSVRPSSAPTTLPWLQIEVRSCRAEDGAWELGCQFTHQPTWNVLMLFG